MNVIKEHYVQDTRDMLPLSFLTDDEKQRKTVQLQLQHGNYFQP